MPSTNRDLHGMVPDKSGAALLLLDVINDMDFDRGPTLVRHALPAAERIAALRARARAAGIPVVYVNDNYGRWRSDFRSLVSHCLEDDVPGRPIVRLLVPGDEDYFVLKPKHSGFYSTSLDVLLAYLEVTTLILTGFAGNICVLFTANDAYMRDFRLVVPEDCTASESPDDNRHAVQQMATVLKADVRPSTELDLERLSATGGGAGESSARGRDSRRTAGASTARPR
jgi:nicotinamidase-related amidase